MRKCLYKPRMKPLAFKQAFFKRIAGGELLQIFDLLPDVSFFIKDRECRFVALNRRGCEYCGVRAEADAMGKTDADFFPLSRASAYMEADREVMTSGIPLLNRIEPAPEMEGSARLVVTSKIPIRDHDGNVIGIAGFSREVEQTGVRSGSTARLARALDALRSGEASDTESLARMAGLSRSQFERTFVQAIGATPHQYLMKTRVETACRQLRETDETLSSIAQQCGFYDHAHFTRCFKSVMGVSPSIYRSKPSAS